MSCILPCFYFCPSVDDVLSSQSSAPASPLSPLAAPGVLRALISGTRPCLTGCERGSEQPHALSDHQDDHTCTRLVNTLHTTSQTRTGIRLNSDFGVMNTSGLLQLSFVLALCSAHDCVCMWVGVCMHFCVHILKMHFS